MPVKLMLVLVLACVCAAARAALPPEIADCKILKIWQFTSSAEGWRPDHNVGPFKLDNGILSFTNSGPDPWIINAEIGGADTSKYGFLGFKMRSSVPGTNQIYFATDKSDMGETTVTQIPVKGDGKWHFYEVNLSKLKSWTGKLNVIRIDPVNGGSEIGAKVDIDWIALYQTPARIMLGRPEQSYPETSRTESGNPWISIPITNTGGEPTPSDMTITTDEFTQTVKPIRPGEKATLTVRCKPTSGDIVVKGQARGETLFVVSMPQISTPNTAGNEMSGKIELDFWGPGGPEARFVEARMSSIRETQWVEPLEGLLGPLATLVYRDSQGTVHYDELSADSHGSSVDNPIADLSCTHKLAQGTATVKWRFAMSKDRPEVDVTCELSADAPVEVLRFEGPQLRLSGFHSWPQTHTHFLFPGLQYLEANEPYTATEFIGPKLADQHIQHPYRIAVPLMAFETSEGIIGMSWDPLQEWAPGHKLPSAQFEPGNKLATVFAPSIPDYVDENHDYATTPYTLKPGEKMTLKMSFFTERGKKITDVIPDYLKTHPLNRSMDSAKVEKVVQTCFKAYAGTLYSSKDKGWKSHFGLHLSYTPNNGYAARVLAESLRTGNPELAKKCDLDPNAQLSQYAGTPLDWFSSGACAAADAAIAKQSADGGFPYEITDEMRKKVKDLAKEQGGIDADTLGTIGETNEGLIARELGAIMDCAIRTGGKKYIEAGLKGLDKLNTFTVPRGAQTWEVHAHAPDVYAAGLAIDLNIAGYHLTGDKKYLDYATFWARTGLPFVYTWAVPTEPIPSAVFHFDENGEGKQPVMSKPELFYSDTKRHINPGSTIAVFGSSFYFVNWFGTPVQWCGLAWADSVQSLMKIRPDAVLQSAADAVFASGAQQQFDKGWAAGTYPDSWNLPTNTVNTAFIAPDTILTYAYGALDEKVPGTISTVGFRGPNGQSCLNSLSGIESSSYQNRILTAKLKLFAGQDVYSCITNTEAPIKVEVDGVELQQASDLKSAPSGWFYDAEHKALQIKYRACSRTADLRMGWN